MFWARLCFLSQACNSRSPRALKIKGSTKVDFKESCPCVSSSPSGNDRWNVQSSKEILISSDISFFLKLCVKIAKNSGRQTERKRVHRQTARCQTPHFFLLDKGLASTHPYSQLPETPITEDLPRQAKTGPGHGSAFMKLWVYQLPLLCLSWPIQNKRKGGILCSLKSQAFQDGKILISVSKFPLHLWTVCLFVLLHVCFCFQYNLVGC